MPSVASDPDLREQVLQKYVSSSPGVHSLHDADEAKRFERAYRAYLSGWFPSRRNNWLDLGCGQGGLLRLAQTSGFAKARGVDASGEMVSACRDAGLDVTQGDVLDVLGSEPPGSWDVVSAFDVLEHMPKQKGFELLRAVRRVLQPDGVCLLKIPNAESPWGFWLTASDLTHEAAYSPWSLQQMGTLAGFAGCDFREVGPVGASVKSLARRGLWQLVRVLYASLHIIETGSAGSRVYTRVMLARLRP